MIDSELPAVQIRHFTLIENRFGKNRTRFFDKTATNTNVRNRPVVGEFRYWRGANTIRGNIVTHIKSSTVTIKNTYTSWNIPSLVLCGSDAESLPHCVRLGDGRDVHTLL